MVVVKVIDVRGVILSCMYLHMLVRVYVEYTYVCSCVEDICTLHVG